VRSPSTSSHAAVSYTDFNEISMSSKAEDGLRRSPAVVGRATFATCS
jgi:hypothetical protein